MAQVLKQETFEAVASAAATVFARLGYRRAMISDIAEAGRVALGTIYRYAQSKEELFELALRTALGESPDVLWTRDGRSSGFHASLIDFVRQRFVEQDHFPVLHRALSGTTASGGIEELREIVAEIHDAIASMHLAIRMVDRSTADWPELAAVFADEVRSPLVDSLARYIERAASKGRLREPPDVGTAARMIIETCATLAMHRHFVSGGPFTDDATARATAIHFGTGSLRP
jgi:AcrR family transcriptional regulator